MLKKESLKKYIDELIQEVEKELEEANVTGNVDGYQTPHAFSRKSDKERRKKNATQLGYSLVDNDVDNITESAGKEAMGIAAFTGTRGDTVQKFIDTHKLNAGKLFNFVKKGKLKDRMDFVAALAGNSGNPIQKKIIKTFGESINENRWLAIKNDESMHANKKLATGLKELKYQLAEVEKFFSWYNKIKNINELDSDNYWKRTNTHIYKIKERLINIARTLQEIEK
jgi:hypothetical protein